MLDTTKVLPPTVAPPTRPLSILQSIRAARRNVLEIIPELAYRQPMLSGRMGWRWHMVQDPGALRRVLLENIENYPKSEVMLRSCARPLVTACSLRRATRGAGNAERSRRCSHNAM